MPLAVRALLKIAHHCQATDTKTGVAEAKPKASSQTDVHPQATAAAAVVSQAAVSSTTVSSSTDKASSVSALGAVHFVVAVAAIVSGGVGIQKVAAEGQQSASVPILGSSGAAPAPTQRVVPVFDKAEFEAVLKGIPAVREVSSSHCRQHPPRPLPQPTPASRLWSKR